MKKKLIVGFVALFMTLGLASCGNDGKTPYIGDNGNWWIGETDTGVPATGPAGQDGKDGSNGTDGNDGTSVNVTSVEKTDTDGLVDTYTITFSDGTATTFTVTNGESNIIENIELTGSNGLVDTYTITFTNGSTKSFTVTNGKDGENLAIISIELKSSEGLIDTYVINYSDGSKFEFVVSNGADGLTPYIGDNGNWWIGDQDTGVLADWEKANNVPLTPYSDGLIYAARTVNGKSGFVVTGWDIGDIDETIRSKYTQEEWDYMYSDEGLANAHLVIPNYIGSVPVIGLAVTNSGEYNFGKITLSRNTIFLAETVFDDCSRLKEIDFNNCNIKAIPYKCFRNTSVGSVSLPSSVTHIYDYAFSGVEMDDFDFTNIEYIGRNAFDTLNSPFVYLPETVKYVGQNAFNSSRVYIEHPSKPDTWATEITSNNELNNFVPVNCKKNDEYLYSIEEEKVTVYQYLGTDRSITIPTTIDEYPVKKVGYGFAAVAPSISKYWANKYLVTGDINSVNPLDVIIIPNGVEEIDKLAFYSANEMVLVPSTVNRVSHYLFIEFDNDLDGHFPSPYPVWDTFATERYIVFEDNDLPIVFDKDGSVISSITKEQLLDGDEVRVAFDVNLSNLEFNDAFCFQNDGLSYSLFAYLGLRTQHLIVPAHYNEKNVTTILSKAFGVENYLKTITIENGISKIRPYAVALCEGEYIYIPNSVLTINAYGVSVDSQSSIYVESNSKPVDWDSNWTYSDVVVYGIGELLENNAFTYTIRNNKVSLIRYKSNCENIYIPSSLDGLPVTEIKNNFASFDGGVDIYIPSSVTKIGAEAFFANNYKQVNVYAEATASPDDWDSNFVGGYGSVTKYWNQTDKFNYDFSEEYVYTIEDSLVSLCAYYGQETDTLRIPRTLGVLTVAKIKSYCFTFKKSTTVYIPNQITTIENIGLNVAGSYNCYFRCEAPSKPLGWNSYWCYNTYSNSTAYCNSSFNEVLDY